MEKMIALINKWAEPDAATAKGAPAATEPGAAAAVTLTAGQTTAEATVEEAEVASRLATAAATPPTADGDSAEAMR